MRRAGLFLLVLLSGGGTTRAQSPGASPFRPTPSALPAAIGQAAQDLNSAPDPEPPLTENLVSFDPASATLSWSDRRWLLVAGGATLKDFGRRDTDARQALRLIHDLRLNQHGTVGSPYPVMEYWLSDGQPPRGLAPGLRTLPVDPASLRAERVQGQWCLRDAQRVLFNFGLRAEDARRALAVVRKYGFNEVGVIGQATPSMLLFLARPNDFARAGLRPPSARIGRNVPPRPGADGPRPGSSAAKLLARFPGAGMDSIVTPAIPPLRPVSHSARRPRTAFRAGQPHSPVPLGLLPGLDDLSNRVPLDWRQVRLRQENGGWQLVAGDYVVAGFGGDEYDARMALAAAHYYHFTEHCRVGGSDCPLAYFLVNGQAPRGVMLGVTGVTFQPDAVTLQQVGPCWNLCSGSSVLMRLGERPEEAKQLLEAIQRYQFDRLCHLGTSENQGMTFFVRSR